MIRILLALLIAASLSLSGAAATEARSLRHGAPAKEQEVYKGWTCNDVRLFVQQNGRLQALAIAVAAGASAGEIQKARNCIGRKS